MYGDSEESLMGQAFRANEESVVIVPDKSACKLRDIESKSGFYHFGKRNKILVTIRRNP